MKRFFQRIWNGIKTFFSGFRKKVKVASATSRAITGTARTMVGSLFVITLVGVVNTVAFIYGSGILYSAAVAGLAALLSIMCLFASAPSKVKRVSFKFLYEAGFWLDALATIVLTIAGFTSGATLGILMMFLGFNISAGIGAIRVLYATKFAIDNLREAKEVQPAEAQTYKPQVRGAFYQPA